ncbi:DUF4194 domain-containing protein [Demequina pelophila]|uniref:DUF4194 domain-containing protein n=1 Tax=Demequina pelophila TaxID=1638984 RepID=UPI000A61F1F9|nr:DUF4194 domain-containing protein [Demequina pelophila]
MTHDDPDLAAAGEAFDARPRLWPGDTGALVDGSRRALLSLVRGPYLSRDREPANWAALLADEPAIRSRLHDLFLDLVLDPDAEVAFVRSVAGEGNDAPVAVRSEALTYLDTVMLLALRQRLIHDEGQGRVIVGQDELYEELQVFRSADRDEADFTKRLNSSWGKMLNKLRVLHTVEEGRAEISPVVRLLVDADRVRELRAAFEAAR